MIRITEIYNQHLRNPKTGEYEVEFHDESSGYRERLPLDQFLYKMGIIGTVETAKMEVLSILQSRNESRIQELFYHLDRRYKDELYKAKISSHQRQAYYNSPSIYPYTGVNYHPLSNPVTANESIEKEKTLSKRDREIYYLTS